MAKAQAWRMHQTAEPLRLETLELSELAADQALVRVAGCGLCHTDLGFFYDGVRTFQPPPLTLGHEISGIVEDAGPACREWIGRAVIVPAVLTCGECDLCRSGRATSCRRQSMPGNHFDGGFASHVVATARSLCPVDVADADTKVGNSGITLKELSAVADAVTTPYQAIRRCGLVEGDVAIFVGVGGVGGFGVQIAQALGATVVALDVNTQKLERIAGYGADLTLDAAGDPKAIRKAIRQFAKDRSLPPVQWKIFECSGTAAGQRLAFGLLTHGATLGVVGFTMDKLELRLSNLMAFDAQAIGNWGCDPALYPEALELVEQGRVQLAPFVETFPMSRINEIFERTHRGEIAGRPVLIPDFD